MIRELLCKIQSDFPELALRLNLQAVQAINGLTNVLNLEDIAYEFMSQAFLIYEEKIIDSEPKIQCLNQITTTLYQLTCFGAENFDALCVNCITYNNTILKKKLQA